MNAIVLRNLDELTLARITELASTHRHSVEEEAAELLRRAVRSRAQSSDRARDADRIAAMTPPGVVQTDSVILIREDRDR